MKKKKPAQLYFKMFWSYTAIVLCIVSVLVIYFISDSKKRILENNRQAMERINREAAEYIEETEKTSDYLFQDLYRTETELEDLEPYLKLIKENEPDVVPMYLTKDYTAPTYMDKIQDPVGIEYGDDTLTVKNVFETEKMKSTLDTMRKYYLAGYINKDAATASDDKSVKRFVTKGDGQPYAELTWGKDLGYEVVATQIMDTQITNASARGALTAINKNCEHPEKAMELLNLINTDQELRNMLNYGIEGVHWEKVEATQEEKDAAAGKDYIYDYKAKLIPEKQKDYSAPYYVQGGLFNTYVMDNEPLDKWATFKEFNDASQEAPSFGFDFESGAGKHTGSRIQERTGRVWKISVYRKCRSGRIPAAASEETGSYRYPGCY